MRTSLLRGQATVPGEAAAIVTNPAERGETNRGSDFLPSPPLRGRRAGGEGVWETATGDCPFRNPLTPNPSPPKRGEGSKKRRHNQYIP
jgi:hypothetical protein